MLNTEDYLGIASLALSYLAEDVAQSQDPAKVSPIIVRYVSKASEQWLNEKERAKKKRL